MWENINYNESSLQPYISDENPKSLTPSTLPTTIIDTDDGTIFDIKSQKPAFTSTQLDYSVDAIPFVLNPDNNNEIVRVDRYYDKEIDPINYNLATEGKINYYLFLLESGRLIDEEVMTNKDLYKIRNPKQPKNNFHQILPNRKIVMIRIYLIEGFIYSTLIGEMVVTLNLQINQNC